MIYGHTPRFFVFGVFVLFFSGVSSKVTEKQYASMPVLFHFDDYDRCMFHGPESLYCMIDFQLYPENPENTTEIWDIIEEVSSKPVNYRHDLLRHGICITETCPHIIQNFSHTQDSDYEKLKPDISTCYSKKYQKMGLRGEVVKMNCEGIESPYPLTNYDIVFAVFIIAYVVFVIFASLYEGTARYKTVEEYNQRTGTSFGRFVSAFSIAKNWYRLTTINVDNPDVEALRSMQGVRFYNMICVILMHTVMINLAVPVTNPQYTETMTEKPLNLLLANGGYAVQTFFMMSGWLLTYNTFLYFEGKRKMNFKFMVLAFINRYIRLTPTLAIVIAFQCSTWFVRLSRGPLWDQIVGDEHRRCKENWWTNLLYINNYVNRERTCMQQTWYLAADTQLFILSLIILFFMNHYQKLIPVILGFNLSFGMVILAILSYVNDFDIVNRPFPERLRNFFLDVRQWHVMYSSGYSNITGYVLGITFGYIFFKLRHKKFNIGKMFVILWWIISFGLTIFIILIAAPMYEENYKATRTEAAAYWALGKNIFAFGVGIGILGFTRKIGWLAFWVIRWSRIMVLARLTFSAYLVHVGLIKLKTGIIRAPKYINDYTICLPQSWYLAVDTQFFIISLICLWFMLKDRKKIPLIVGGLLGTNMVILFTIIYWNNWESSLRPTPESVYLMSVIHTTQWHIILGSVYAHLSGLAAGLGYGYIFYKYRHKNLFRTKLQVTIWWIVVWGFGLGIIIIPGSIMYSPTYEPIRLFGAVYGSISRIVFIFGVGLGIFGFTQGIGWMAKWACEWYPTYFLGRLSYSAYLVHVIFVNVRGGSRRTPTFLADHVIFGEVLSDIASGFIYATFLTLFVELPVSGLQKILIPNPKQEAKEVCRNNNDKKLT